MNGDKSLLGLIDVLNVEMKRRSILMSEEKPTIMVSYGITVNLGNYESERMSCSLTLPLEDVFEVQFDQMFKQIKMKVLEKGGKFGEPMIKAEPLMTEEIERKEPVKKPNAPKIEMGKVYNYKKKDGTPTTCSRCGGLISWDDRPERIYPMHVDDKGHIVGDGDCPMFGG